MNYLRESWKKCFCYTGRASRKEYWMTFLWNIVSVVVAGILSVILRIPWGLPYVQDVLAWVAYALIIMITLYVIGSFLMFLALAVRRIHDIGLCGWWVLVGFIPFIGAIVIFVFTVMRGNTGDNKYGPDPIKPIVVPVAGMPSAGGQL
jgi:uncharacterized membrane protein YhaH (DUF805 family)